MLNPRCLLQKYDLLKVALESKKLSEEEHAILRNILSKYKLPFNRKTCIWITKPIDIELQLDA